MARCTRAASYGGELSLVAPSHSVNAMYPTVNREHVLRLASWHGVASGGQREAFLWCARAVVRAPPRVALRRPTTRRLLCAVRPDKRFCNRSNEFVLSSILGAGRHDRISSSEGRHDHRRDEAFLAALAFGPRRARAAAPLASSDASPASSNASRSNLIFQEKRVREGRDHSE